jgi:hypothetical protein
MGLREIVQPSITSSVAAASLRNPLMTAFRKQVALVLDKISYGDLEGIQPARPDLLRSQLEKHIKIVRFCRDEYSR